MVLLFISSIFKIQALAYTTAYYRNQVIKVALTDMKGTTININLSGDYTFGDNILKSGTSVALSLNTGKILLNGVLYDTVTLTPLNSGNMLTLNLGTLNRTYKGSMLFKINNSAILPINTVNIEDYTKGVIGYEMSDSYPLEALKAQAVASRSYGQYHIDRHGPEYDVTDTTSFQVYRGINSSFKNVERAVDETRGEMITYGGNVVEALYSACDGGYTEASENVWTYAFAYYTSKKDDFDDYSKYDNSRSYNWTKELTSQQLTDILNRNLSTTTNKFVRINLDTITTYASSRVKNLELVYSDVNNTEQTKTLTKDNARTFFGFPSSMYTVTYNDAAKSYTFTGHGWGHGIGMSQIGALNRACAGQTYKDIINFYYTGANLTKGIAAINSFAESRQEIFTSEDIELNTTYQDGLGSGSGFLYKYVIESNGNTVYTRDYASDSKLIYNTDKIGEYSVTVYLKDVQSKAEYDDKRSLTFKVTGMGDANLDSIVDIFDLVKISKQMDQRKETSSNWDEKLDLNRDGVIDILDISKASQNYNVKY